MAAVSMTMAVVGARFAAQAPRTEAVPARAASSLTMAAPSSTMWTGKSSSTTSRHSAMNSAIVARASDLGQSAEAEVAAELEQGPPPGPKLYFGNLPWKCDSAQLAEQCQEHGTVEAVEVIYDVESGRSRGFAFVTMASVEDAQAVIAAMDGSNLDGRVLRVNYPQAKGDRPRFEKGERPERRQSEGRRREDSPNKLFVGNLDWGCTNEALHQLFSDYGKVVEARVVTDRETGRSRGFGFVTLDNASEVNSAIESLDGTEVDGRQLRVNLAENKQPPRS